MSDRPADAESRNPYIPPVPRKPVPHDPPVAVPQAIKTSVVDAKKKSVNEVLQLNLEAMGIRSQEDLDGLIRQTNKRIADLETEKAASDPDGGDKK